MTKIEDIIKKYQWAKNTDPESEAIANTFLRYMGNDEVTDRHNKAVEDAVKEAIKTTLSQHWSRTPEKVWAAKNKQETAVNIFKDIKAMLTRHKTEMAQTIKDNEKNFKEFGMAEEEIATEKARLQSCIAEADIALTDMEAIERRYITGEKAKL